MAELLLDLLVDPWGLLGHVRVGKPCVVDVVLWFCNVLATTGLFHPMWFVECVDVAGAAGLPHNLLAVKCAVVAASAALDGRVVAVSAGLLEFLDLVGQKRDLVGQQGSVAG